MTTVAIHQPQYLPYLGFFHKIAHCDVFVALDNVQFYKNGFENRNKIKNSTGWQWLTVPVLQKLNQEIRDVLTNNKLNWPRKHAQAIRTSYGKSPHFDWCWEKLKPVYESEWSHLSPLNMRLTELVCESLDIKTPVVYASALSVEGNATERLINICRALNADAYLSGPGGKQYMETERFQAAGIKIIWQQFEFPTYEQVFADVGFQPSLSVIDTLAACGPAARDMIHP